MKKTTIVLLTAALLATIATSALAWRSVRTGDRNFERAWRVYCAGEFDKAQSYFKRAAEGYGAAMQEDPLPRTMRFPSTLLKAGMTFYFAGSYEECIEAMKRSHRKNERLWEADIFTALAYARLGDKENCLNNLQLYLDGMSSQRTVIPVVQTQITAIEKNTPLNDSADLIQQSIAQQINSDVLIYKGKRSASALNERCDGQFWWRKNDSPCMSSGYWP